VEKLPLGPLLGIMPWNYPYYQLLRFAIPNLVIGNTVIIKPAEACPRSALLIQEIMDAAGVPAGAYTTIFATHAQVAGLIADPRVQGVSLTGSERAGAAIGELAGRNLKKAVLELGGSDPYIILDTADVSESARAAWATRMSNMGQACNSNKRIIVMDEIFDEFVSELTLLAKDLKPGDPRLEEEGTFSPMASREAAEQVAEQVRDAVEKGATLHAGGELAEGSGAYMYPTVLTGVTEEMRAYREELFGPVAVVYSVSSEEEAIHLANDSAYGLGGAVFSTDFGRAANEARNLETGMTHVNTAAAYGAQLPFGGIKRSGFGRELGPAGMDEFVNKRLLYINR
jgi:succinate-semialdehyde dehydrogenase/glutarate-semialdehyde dehydrogenase